MWQWRQGQERNTPWHLYTGWHSPWSPDSKYDHNYLKYIQVVNSHNVQSSLEIWKHVIKTEEGRCLIIKRKNVSLWLVSGSPTISNHVFNSILSVSKHLPRAPVGLGFLLFLFVGRSLINHLMWLWELKK